MTRVSKLALLGVSYCKVVLGAEVGSNCNPDENLTDDEIVGLRDGEAKCYASAFPTKFQEAHEKDGPIGIKNLTGLGTVAIVDRVKPSEEEEAKMVGNAADVRKENEEKKEAEEKTQQAADAAAADAAPKYPRYKPPQKEGIFAQAAEAVGYKESPTKNNQQVSALGVVIQQQIHEMSHIMLMAPDMQYDHIKKVGSMESEDVQKTDEFKNGQLPLLQEAFKAVNAAS